MREDSKLRRLLCGLPLIAVLVALDQWTKKLAVAGLKGQAERVLVPSVLSLGYTENSGMAFGMMQGGRTIFLILTVVLLAAMLVGYLRLPGGKKMCYMRKGLLLIMAGAIGNMIDRALYGYVVDFIWIRFIDFPLFNLADMYVTFTAFLLAALVLFYYKEDDFKKKSL